MLGFELGFWDYVTFAALTAAGASFVVILLWFAGLPGRIALARKHSDAEAVNLMGWAGIFPTVLPWVQAFIWAFKQTNIVDIRRFPQEEARAIEENINRLSGKTTVELKAASPDAASGPTQPAPDFQGSN